MPYQTRRALKTENARLQKALERALPTITQHGQRLPERPRLPDFGPQPRIKITSDEGRPPSRRYAWEADLVVPVVRYTARERWLAGLEARCEPKTGYASTMRKAEAAARRSLIDEQLTSPADPALPDGWSSAPEVRP